MARACPGSGWACTGSRAAGPARGRSRTRSRSATATSIRRRSTATRRTWGARCAKAACRASEVFVVTKLWNSDQGYAQAIKACNASLAKLKLDYIDLYLIHWPEPGKRLDSWRALGELRKQGKCRSIGVSNYTIAHLEELLARLRRDAGGEPGRVQPLPLPARAPRILPRARHPARGLLPPHPRREAGDPTVGAIARRHGKTPAQVLLRWALQHEVVVIPKSGKPERIDRERRSLRLHARRARHGGARRAATPATAPAGTRPRVR